MQSLRGTLILQDAQGGWLTYPISYEAPAATQTAFVFQRLSRWICPGRKFQGLRLETSSCRHSRVPCTLTRSSPTERK